MTAVSSISDGALKNLQDKNEHGFHSRLRLGVDARINDHTNVKVVASAQGQTGVDASHETTGSRGLNHTRLESLDVTQHRSNWDFSIGRLTEQFGQGIGSTKSLMVLELFGQVKKTKFVLAMVISVIVQVLKTLLIHMLYLLSSNVHQLSMSL